MPRVGNSTKCPRSKAVKPERIDNIMTSTNGIPTNLQMASANQMGNTTRRLGVKVDTYGVDCSNDKLPNYPCLRKKKRVMADTHGERQQVIQQGRDAYKHTNHIVAGFSAVGVDCVASSVGSTAACCIHVLVH